MQDNPIINPTVEQAKFLEIADRQAIEGARFLSVAEFDAVAARHLARVKQAMQAADLLGVRAGIRR